MDCELDVVAQLTQQPEAPDEMKNRLLALKNAANKVDEKALQGLNAELDTYYQDNQGYYKKINNLSDTNFIHKNAKMAEQFVPLYKKTRFL